VVLAVDFAHGELVLAREAKPLACRIHTRESSEVGSLHEVLLEYSWLLSQGLHTTRRLLSISVMITGHYPLRDWGLSMNGAGNWDSVPTVDALRQVAQSLF
jgi:hypothetical protein